MPERTAAELHALKCELAGEVLRSSGKLRMQVAGWSMAPAIWPGDTLLIEPTDAERVEKGDIVLFQRDRRLFVHRVAGQTEDLQIVTQGDGMLRPDPPITGSQLLGKVSFIVRDGRLLEPAKSLGFGGRAVAAVVRRSSSAVRVFAEVRAMTRFSHEPASRRRDPQEPSCQN